MTRLNTLDIQGLEALLRNLGARVPIPAFSEILSFPQENPVDIYRLYLTQATNQLINCDSAKVYDGFQQTSIISKGDLALVTPRLGFRGKKPDEMAAEIASKVCELPQVNT
jgi:arginyl-tRNA synthetase